MADIYKEDRYATPKWVFKMSLAMLDAHFGAGPIRLLDVGTADAALPNFIISNRPDWTCTAVEFDPILVELAQTNVPRCTTLQGDVNDLAQFSDGAFDSVTCIGVISIFDDYRPAMNEMIRVTGSGGLVLVQSLWNSFPLDIIIRTRHATSGPQEDSSGWEAGWNMISLATMSAFLDHHPRVKAYDFTKVSLPYDIPGHPDNVLRSWTEMGADGERYHMNGIGRLLDKRLLRIEVS
jgi:SAM-dependent methyltransferase